MVVRGSSAAEPVTDLVNGFFCEDTTESLAEVMVKAVEDPHLLANMGIEARRTIPISWNGIMETVLERYQYLIDRRTNRESAERQEVLI